MDKRGSAYWTPDNRWCAENKKKILALQAVYHGTANEGQQIMAISFIIDEFCGRGANQYYPSERDTTFALGKKFVGDLIAGALNAKTGKIQEAKQ
jgi:hypothetical protein